MALLLPRSKPFSAQTVSEKPEVILLRTKSSREEMNDLITNFFFFFFFFVKKVNTKTTSENLQILNFNFQL